MLIDDPILCVGPTYADDDNPLGSMFNGGHRCTAVVATGVAIPVYIDRDANPHTFDVIDGGYKRTAYQFIGESYAAQRAAAARLILWYERRFDRPPGGVNLAFDMHEVLTAAEDHAPALDKVLALGGQTAEYTGLAPSVATAAYALAVEQGYERQVKSFVAGVIDPSSIAVGEPARLLADRFRKQVHRGRRRSSIEDWTILVRALNLHIQGRSASRLVLGSVWPFVGESEAQYRTRTQEAVNPRRAAARKAASA